jgi:hypothetical protein
MNMTGQNPRQNHDDTLPFKPQPQIMKTILNHIRNLTTLAACTLGLVATFPATAATDTWSGGATPDGNWTTANNWGGTAPLPNDFLFFDGGIQTLTTNNFSAGTTFGGLIFNSGADAFTLSGNDLTLITFTNGIDASTVTPVGGNITNLSGSAETISLPITLSAGKHAFANAGGGPLNINGAVTRNPGAVAVFDTSGGAINVTGGLDTNGLNNILGCWATMGNDWATLDASSNVVAYADYTPIAAGAIPNAPAGNLKYVSDTAVLTAANGTAINSLVVEQGVARSLTVATGGILKLGAKGGIYRDVLAAGVFTVTGGFLTANGGGEINLFDSPFNATGGNNLVVNSVITNDGPNVVSVNILGYVQIAPAGNT